MWKRSRDLGVRPSDLCFLDNVYDAYCFDEAVWVFGTRVEAAVSKAAESRGKKDTDKARQARADSMLKRMLGLIVDDTEPPELLHMSKKQRARLKKQQEEGTA